MSAAASVTSRLRASAMPPVSLQGGRGDPESLAPSPAPWRWLAVALFWAGWGAARYGLGDVAWLHLAARCWLACSVAELTIHLLTTRWPRLRLFGVIALSSWAAMGAAFLWGVVLPRVSAGRGWRDVAIASSLALLLTLPPLVQRWRAHRREQARLRQAEAAAQLAALSRDKALAELNLLQAQVEPHFLYNTLAAMQYLIRHDPPRAGLMMERLHDYLRQSLPAMRAPMSTLDREFQLARSYLELMQMRLGERLRFTLDLPADLAPLPMPPMMLGTLVENAIKHGIEPKAAGGEIRVRAQREDGRLALVVDDTGVGLSTDPAHATAGTGVGLDNLRERLRALWPDAAGLEVAARAPEGVRARLWWPLAPGADGEGR